VSRTTTGIAGRRHGALRFFGTDAEFKRRCHSHTRVQRGAKFPMHIRDFPLRC
jgi:hypothetical protein